MRCVRVKPFQNKKRERKKERKRERKRERKKERKKKKEGKERKKKTNGTQLASVLPFQFIKMKITWRLKFA